MPHQLQCKSCPQNYELVSEFIEHVKIHAIEKDKTKKQKTENKIKLQASMLQRSIDIKLENEEIKSYICGKDLRKPSSEIPESRHENDIRKAYSCDICDKIFSNRFNLKIHVKNVHGKVKEHICNLCKKSFGQNKNL